MVELFLMHDVQTGSSRPRQAIVYIVVCTMDYAVAVYKRRKVSVLVR
jgi:hypothetical protein